MSILQQDRELLTSFAEGVGMTRLDKEIEDLLLSDLESKLLEIIQVCIVKSDLYFRKGKSLCDTQKETF